MGVSFGEVIGDVQPDTTESTEPAQAAAQAPAAPLDPIAFRREVARLTRRDARLKAT